MVSGQGPSELVGVHGKSSAGCALLDHEASAPGLMHTARQTAFQMSAAPSTGRALLQLHNAPDSKAGRPELAPEGVDELVVVVAWNGCMVGIPDCTPSLRSIYAEFTRRLSQVHSDFT